MSPVASRRSLLRGCLAATGVSLAGCSALAEGPRRRYDWADAADLAVHNRTTAERRVEARLYELDSEADSDMRARTVSETPPATQRPLVGREFVVPSEARVEMRNVLQKRDEATAYRLVVRVDEDHVAVFAFQTQYGSGMVAIVVDVRSPDDVQFSRPTV